MDPARLTEALRTGTQRVAAWAELLDAINVYPVADGDTGRNLVLSLRPLLDSDDSAPSMAQRLLRAACGNAGNIATRFITPLLAVRQWPELPQAAAQGRRQAYAALAQPVAGTMLDVLDALELGLRIDGAGIAAPACLLQTLQQAVHHTPQRLPRLAAARVVDSGALGMLLWLEGAIAALCDLRQSLTPPTTLFEDWLTLAPDAADAPVQGFCIESLVRLRGDSQNALRRTQELGESVVVSAHEGVLKLHLHAREPAAVRAEISALGQVESFCAEPLQAGRRGIAATGVGVITDGAASLSRATAENEGLALLDSYVLLAGQTWPETRIAAPQLYAAMRRGERASTSQASLFERHQHYQRLQASRSATLYLCVGAAYTGIWTAAQQWARQNADSSHLAVIDSGAASGRLALAALATARAAANGLDFAALQQLAREAAAASRELLFLERLRYLAAGGRLSRASALCGDFLGVRPAISPEADGARRVASARTPQAGLRLVLARLAAELPGQGRPLVLLEYSDNRNWVGQQVLAAIRAQHPQAEILLEPLSLTTGVHTGPGTWGVAWLPWPSATRPPKRGAP